LDFLRPGGFDFSHFTPSRQFFGYFLSAQKVVRLSANQPLLRTGIKRCSAFLIDQSRQPPGLQQAQNQKFPKESHPES